jgi:23S rRNA pseudouridine1911/1915/1917 synthase
VVALGRERRGGTPIPDAPGPAVEVHLGPECAGRRLDRALADRFPDASRTAVTAWIREGRVLVDGEALPPRTRLRGGEVAVVRVPPPRPLDVRPEEIPLTVLVRDDEFLVLDKPAGLAVHPGSGRPGGTLANALAFHLGRLPELAGADRPGIVHRLDRETSGAIVVALTEPAQRALSRAFARREVEKTYLALVHGVPDLASGEVNAPLGRSPRHRTKMAVREGGRVAQTAWRVARAFPRHALLECRPRTGRTHQIRVHAAHLGHPIVGDRLYGRAGAPGEEHAPRLMLHAFRLAFPHPRSGERVEAEAPVPTDFETCAAALAGLEPSRRARPKPGGGGTVGDRGRR